MTIHNNINIDVCVCVYVYIMSFVDTLERGDEGEEVAKSILKGLGFSPFDNEKQEQLWRLKRGTRKTPFDILAIKDGVLYGIQVKYGFPGNRGKTVFSFTWRNLERIKWFSGRLYYIPMIMFISGHKDFMLFEAHSDNIPYRPVDLKELERDVTQKRLC